VGLRGELPSLEVHGIAHLVGNVNLGRGGLNLREGRLHLDGHTFRAIQVSSDSASRILMSSPIDSLVVERGILLHKAASTITSGAIVTPSISIPEHYVAPRSVRITINTNGSNDRITVADSTSSFSVLEIRGSQPLAGYNQ